MSVLDLPKNTNQLSGEVGKDFLIYLDKGAKRPSWVLLGGQRGLTLNRTAEEIDVSNKTTGGWTAKKTGLRGWSIDADGIVVLNDEGVQIAETAFNEGKEVHVKCEYPDNKYCEGWGSITDFSMDAPSDGEATISMTIAGNGPIKISDKPTGIYLDGVSTYITIPSDVVGGKQIFTIELKLCTPEKRSSSNIWNAPCLCGNSINGSNQGDINIGVKDGKLVGSIALGHYGDPDIITNDYISDGSVCSISLVCDGNKATLYKGKNAYPTTCGVTRGLANEKLYFGYSLPLGGGRAEMTLYEARFWDIARKPAELGNKIAGNESGLRAWYRCLETSENILKDSSSKKFDGTIVGNVWG